MEIKDFAEIHALNKLLWMVKFQKDVDFDELTQFAMSPTITSIFERVNKDFTDYAKEKKFGTNLMEFKLDNHFGEVVKTRIIGWAEDNLQSMIDITPTELTQTLKQMISPLTCDKNEFDKLEVFTVNLIKQKST